MKRLFIHYPLFRLLSPLFSGIMAYVLILLINNNVEQLEEYFLGEELYFCIGLAYVTQEFSRLSLVLFEKWKTPWSEWKQLIVQLLSSILLTILLVSGCIYSYYHYMLGFDPSFSELVVFNSIFSGVTAIYISLYLSHQMLYRINTRKLENELKIKEGIEADFRQFKQGINPQLLFESFEALIVLMHKDPESAEFFMDHLSRVYRYILSGKGRELVPIKEELNALSDLIALFSYLPYRNIFIEKETDLKTWVIPGSLLFLAEQIIRSTIRSTEIAVNLKIYEEENSLCLSYQMHEKITQSLQQEQIQQIKESYAVYSDYPVIIQEKNNIKTIEIPQLIPQT